ncbi:MAG TPA: putative metalloprotease CJM1_0395 family protein [Ignavibacteriales bacterium]|nr:putative metalloprotease CJM1_0395 family protein [Ignavibacteriales bacterium]HPD66605.1 putative metalloprotease CJM1_0395 family protein [Ignavibacteriales bacterium]HRR17615.1 putative metalloprotease CJM1_0395 family protein [Ignavibacteriales bacterium]
MPVYPLKNISYKQEVNQYQFSKKNKEDFKKVIIEEVSSQWDTKDTYEPSKEDKILKKLKEIDQKVKNHEVQHQVAAGELYRGTSYSYQRGPDGNQYAVAGEVKIDIQEVQGDPEATVVKMQKVKRAALAPSDPSPQDYSVARQAERIEQKAKLEAQKKLNEKTDINKINSPLNNDITQDSQEKKEPVQELINKIYSSGINIFMQGNFVNVVA